MVSITTGMSASSGSALRLSSTLQPSRSGISTSRVISIGLSSRASARPSAAVPGGDHLETLAGEEAPHQIPHRLLIVDDEHPVAAPVAGRAAGAALSARRQGAARQRAPERGS